MTACSSLSVAINGSRVITACRLGSVWGSVVLLACVCRRHLSSVVVGNTPLCNINHQGAACDGGPVVLRPVRATPCYICVVQI